MLGVIKYCTSLAILIIIFNLRVTVTVTEITGNKYVGIWNGEVVEIESCPFLASIQFNNEHVCGGIIVSDRFLLTTATCFRNYGTNKTAFTVVAGSNRLEIAGETFTVEDLVIHEKYDTSNDHDIGLLKVDRNIDFSPKVAIASLAERGAIYEDGTVFELIGWGTDSDTKYGVLKKTTVGLIDRTTCIERNGDEFKITKYTICAATDDHGPCFGDLGTPLLLNGTVAGIASRTKRCASERYPTVYTSISEFRDWIDDAMKPKTD